MSIQVDPDDLGDLPLEGYLRSEVLKRCSDIRYNNRD